MRKLSAVALEMATTVLRKPDGIPSTEAAHAALLSTHVAWNKALGDLDALRGYQAVLTELEQANPALWNELKSADHREMIDSLVAYRQKHYPNDTRVIKVCGMRAGNVHVEWTEG